MSEDQETGNRQGVLVEPIEATATVLPPSDPFWNTWQGWVPTVDMLAPVGDELAGRDVGVAAQASREHIEVALSELGEFAALWART